MAEATVRYVLDKLADVLQKKAKELYAVSGQINQMQNELRLIQALLKDADSKRNRDELVKEWVNQVRDMAHRIEDAIDTFLVEIQENSPESSHLLDKVKTVVKKPYKKTYKLYKMNKLAGELKNITQELIMIYQRRTDLGITVHGADGEQNGQVPFRPTKPSQVDDSEVVGLDDDKRKVINQLLDRNISRRTVLSIVGTGGLGKTTLAQKVYKSVELEGQFDCRTWLSISQKFDTNDILRKILYSIEPTMENKNPPVTDEDLPAEVQKSLSCKRYLIILDDVWSTCDWDQLKIGLPDPKNASRVIITTRSLDVANVADCNTEPYQLCYLNSDASLALLFRKAFQQHIQPENYPPDLLEVAKRLAKKCGGLPMALVVLGGILSRRERKYTAWSTKMETMDWHDEDGKKCSQVLAMSYEDLPYELKPCFLYFACYPEDYKISGKHITRMWMAEGFVPKDGGGTMEDRADKCLEELAQRCLIQVTKKSWNGYCKYCSMHDLLRDLAIRKAKEENFFTVFSKQEDDVNHLSARKPRRASLQFCTLTEDGVYSENTRSLLCFGFGQSSSNDCGFRILNYSGFRLLRVLTLEHVDITNKFDWGQWTKGLIHLRYFGLRHCYFLEENFKNISFNNLETIDLKGSHVVGTTTYCSDVVIPTLRHIYGPLFYEVLFALKWDLITNLQTLKGVGQEEVPKLEFSTKNLRTLGVYYKRRTNRDEEWETLKGVLRRTEKLVSLSIATKGTILVPFGKGGTRGLPCHETIQSLHLNGEWNNYTHSRVTLFPSVEMFPTNLTKLTLKGSRLENDPMPIFEKLQGLRILRLRNYSYNGTNLICSTGGFPKLEKLELIRLYMLTKWDINEGAMPILNRLKIKGCFELHALPELQNVRSLQELSVVGSSNELKQLMQGKDLYKTKHIPSVRITR